MDECIFCGTHVKRGEKCRRAKTFLQLSQFVGGYCRKTPYAFQALEKVEDLKGVFYDKSFENKKELKKLPLCIPCVNWQRRCMQGKRKRWGEKKPYLLFDQLIKFMLEPGSITFPDHRCSLRIIKSLIKPTKKSVSQFLRQILPIPVSVMIDSISPDFDESQLIHVLVKAWWDFNGKPVFFSNQRTARLVRKMIKFV